MKSKKSTLSARELCDLIEKILDDKKADDIVTIDLVGKTAIADYFIIATGQSGRQVSAMAEILREELKKYGIFVAIEGQQQADWVLVDANDVIVHLFRPEIRSFYNLEKMWAVNPSEASSASS